VEIQKNRTDCQKKSHTGELHSSATALALAVTKTVSQSHEVVQEMYWARRSCQVTPFVQPRCALWNTLDHTVFWPPELKGYALLTILTRSLSIRLVTSNS